MKLSLYLVDWMVNNNVVKEEERDIYDYGVDQIVFTGLNIITMIIIGVVTHSLWTIAGFSLFYMVLRVYAGGYHADTQLKCFILSNIMILIVVGVDRWINIDRPLQLAIVVISTVLILWLGPVDTVTKPLDSLERKVYKKRMIIIMIMESALFLVFLMAKFAIVSKCVTLSYLAVAIMLMGGVIDNIKRKEVEE